MQVGNGYFCSSIARPSFCGYNPLQVYFCKGFFDVCRPISGAAHNKNAAINMYDRLRLRIVSV